MFAGKHIKIFCNHWLSELETAVFGEMFVKICFLNFFHVFLFYFAWVSKLVSSEKSFRIIRGDIIWFSLLFFKTKNYVFKYHKKKTDFLANCVNFWIFHPSLRKSQNRLLYNYHEQLLSIGYHSSYSISRNLQSD